MAKGGGAAGPPASWSYRSVQVARSRWSCWTREGVVVGEWFRRANTDDSPTGVYEMGGVLRKIGGATRLSD